MRAKLINEEYQIDESAIERLEKVVYMELKDSEFKCGKCKFMGDDAFCAHKKIQAKVSRDNGCCNLFYPFYGGVVKPENWVVNKE